VIAWIIYATPLYASYACSLEILCGPDGELPEKLRNLEPRLIEHVSNEIMEKDPNVRWDDIGKYKNICPSLYSARQIGILHNYDTKYMSFNDNVAGLEHAKKCIDEMVIYPLQRPDIFMGCRSPGRGLLLFGPPVSANFSCDDISCQDSDL